MLKFSPIFLLSTILIYSQSIFSQSNFNENYQDGQLFVQTKIGIPNNFKETILKDKKFEPFKIKSIERAFKLNTNGLDRVYLIKFSNPTFANEFIQRLKASNYFNYVEKVPQYSFDYTPNDLQSSQWHLPKIMAENAWSIQKGSSKIIIGLVDDALDTAHTDIEPIVWRNTAEIRGNNIDDDGNGYIDDYIGWDVADNDNDPTGGTSLSHGTHCGGIAAAYTDNGSGIASIGFGCKLMAVKTGQTGSNYLSNAYAGIEYCIINKANIISMSWGGGGYSSTYQLLFDDAFSKGIVCVAAAGNARTNFTHYPAGYNYVIAVGSTTSNDSKSSFSNYGTWVDVMAPGSSIYSTLPNNTYGTYSGTSMACPLVSGLCGLMLSKNPNATPTEIENCLKSGCKNIDTVNSSYIGQLGAGRINAENSLRCIKAIKAKFTSNFKQVCPGDTIQFTDLSIPAPVSLKWLFPGGSPSSTFISKPKIRYATAGVYDVTLIAFGNSVSDTLILKKYITVAKPKATLSLNRTIPLGGSTTIKLDFTGNAPYSFKISDGSTTTTITNITNTPYYHAVSPTQTTTYTLTSFNDSKCAGTFSGNSKVTVNTSTNCLNAIKYQAYIGGSADDVAYTVTEDPNGNILVSGTTKNYGNGDIFLSKMNKDGTLIWFKTYGGSGNDIAYKHIITKDGGYLLTGTSNSYASNEDGILIKTDTSGAVLWSKTIGGSSREYFQRMVELDNGSVLIGGGSNSYGAGDLDNYLIKIAQNGNLVWTKTYGNSDYNVLTGITSFSDGSIIFSSSYRDGSGDLVIAKTDSLGNLIWSKKCDGSNNDAAYDLTKGNDGNIYTIGAYRTNSDQDICVASFTPNGTLRFIKSYAGGSEDAAYDIKSIDNDILVAGYTNSFGKGGYDGFLLKIDTAGNTMSSKVYGGTSDDLFYGSCISKDGGMYAVGYSKSYTNGGQDVFINKANCKLETGCNEGNFSPNKSNVSSISTITQSVSNGGSFTNQSISATSRNLKLNYNCITPANTNAPCIKIDKYTKISSTTSGFSGLIDNGDQFGQSVKSIGDFDGDGVDDFTASAQLDDDGGTNIGAFYLILMNSDFSIKSYTKISSSQGGFSGNITSDNFFGSNVISVNDMDGDGVKELVSGHIYNNTGASISGAVWIIFMNANGTVKSQVKIANGSGGLPSGTLGGGDNFGMNLTNAGDLDYDGIDDIIVGSRFDDNGGTDRGAVYILYLNSNGTVKSFKKISSSSTNFTSALNNGDGFGFSVSANLDLNNDGNQDIVVGASGVDDGGSGRGGIFILFLDASQNIISYSKISSTSGNFSGQLDNGDNFGNGVETLGDIDNDGISDIVVSAPYDDDGGTDRGAAWILFLKKNGTVKSYFKISSTSKGAFNNILDNSDAMGYTVSATNDINNDGLKEILIGSMWDDDGGTDRGAVYILNLTDTCPSIIKPNICKLYPKFTNSLGCILDSVEFVDLSTDSFKNSIVNWHWDFGDGNTLKGTPNPKHLYNTIGTFDVKLIISNSADNTCKDSITRQIKIENKFNLGISLTDTICKYDTALISVGVAYCGTTPFTFQWSPANLVQNPTSNLTKVFPTKNTQFTVVVTDKFGQKAYDTVLVVVDTNCCKSFAHFNTNKTQYCFGDTAFINNESKTRQGAIYEWKIAPALSYSNYTGYTAPPLILTKSGIYNIQLIVQDVCGNDTTFKQIYVLPQPIVNAGRDTALCLNDSVQIGDITIGRNSYKWSPNTGLSNHLISNPKAYFTSNIQYILTMLDEEGCKATDTVNITKIIEPKLHIGNDTMLCVKDSLLLKSNVTATNYLWHNGSTQSSIYGKSSGLYWLSAKTKCLQTDSITLTFLQSAKFSLGNDTVVCNSNTLQLKPNINTSGLGLIWDNNTTNTPRNVTTKGMYWLKISNYKCESIDSIFVDFSKTPFVNLGNDTTLCNNASINLNATDINAKKYLWNDGSIQALKTINTKGKYIVELENECGKFSDEINIYTLNNATTYLGKDTNICIGDTIILNAFSPNTNFYQWNDNSTLPTLKVFNAGKYTVQTGNICGNFDTSINISTKICDCNIYMPNVFSPNRTSALNDEFAPILTIDCMPSFYKLQIFDRWGAELFSSTQTSNGWNGQYKDKLVPNGVYVWILTLQHPYMNKNKIFKKTGSVLILE